MSEAPKSETPKPTPKPAVDQNDPLAIANSIQMTEASPKEILELKPNKAVDATSGPHPQKTSDPDKPNKAADATTGSDAVEAAKPAKGKA